MSKPGPSLDEIQSAADTYQAAALSGEKPVKAVQVHFGVSRATAHRWLVKARTQGLLPPPNSHGRGSVAEHEPRRARWASGESWWACRTCRVPWPCAEAELRPTREEVTFMGKHSAKKPPEKTQGSTPPVKSGDVD